MKKVFKRIAAMGAAMVMAVSMMGVGSSAVEINYNLHYSQGVNSSDNKISQEHYIGNYFGDLNHIYVQSKTFTTLLTGGYVSAKNVNTGNSTRITAANKKYTITTNISLSGAMIHNSYKLVNYSASKSIFASGSDSYD